jgi:hypothetical protein
VIAPAKPFASTSEALSATAGTKVESNTPLARMFASFAIALQAADDRLELLKDVRKALDAGNLFVTRGEGRGAACSLLDRLNEAIGDARSEAVRKAARSAE